MLNVNDVIKPKRFGTKRLVTKVTTEGVYTKMLKPLSSNELTVDEDFKESFISFADIKRKGFIKSTSMSLKQGTIGSAWN
ncbi:hypothetical protein VP14_163 [Vibrio phage VPMCC14]|nr:hypothetical protein VP14_163 [Vibrio phage VPMCC14]